MIQVKRDNIIMETFFTGNLNPKGKGTGLSVAIWGDGTGVLEIQTATADVSKGSYNTTANGSTDNVELKQGEKFVYLHGSADTFARLIKIK